jgi:hypothetical protein
MYDEKMLSIIYAADGVMASHQVRDFSNIKEFSVKDINGKR